MKRFGSMSYLHAKAKCGRIVKRPNEVEENEEENAEGIRSLQLMTESLRSKIALKERYNKALMDELQESKAGASQMVLDLISGNEELRVERCEAVIADRAAGSKAIRAFRDIQLAMGGKRPVEILDWLEDQLGDLRRKVDRAAHTMKILKYQLSESEKIVLELEEAPICGAAPWQIEAEKKMIQLCVKISERQTRRESAQILNSKYHDILTNLKDQKGNWPIEVKQVQDLVDKFKVELEDLENMLTDALRLRDLAKERYEITQEEFANNRSVRKKILAAIKRQVEKGIADNIAKFAKNDPALPKTRTRNMIQATPGASQVDLTLKPVEILKQMQADVAVFEAKASALVEAMHVPDMRYCPHRLANLWKVRDALFEAAHWKYNLRQELMKKKAYMSLLLCHVKFTGGQDQEEYTEQVEEMKEVMKEAKARQASIQRQFQALEEHAVDWELALVGIDDLLNQGKYHTKHKPHEDIVNSMRLVNFKLSTLLSDIKAIRDALPKRSSKVKDDVFKPFVKPVTPMKNACRLSTVYNDGEHDAAEDEDDDEFTLSSIDVPTADDIKALSSRVAKQGKMRRGIKVEE